MNTKRVVVAEDEPLVRLLVAGAMTDAGFDVLEAGHAEEALGHLQSRFATIHLLFTDIHMPGEMTGLALARYVREKWPHIALLITSGQLPAEELPAGSLFAANILRFNGIHNVSDGRHRIAFGGVSAILAMRVMY